jgi:hypothetical protein
MRKRLGLAIIVVIVFSAMVWASSARADEHLSQGQTALSNTTLSGSITGSETLQRYVNPNQDSLSAVSLSLTPVTPLYDWLAPSQRSSAPPIDLVQVEAFRQTAIPNAPLMPPSPLTPLTDAPQSSLAIQPVPEPSTIGLFSIGILALVAFRKHIRQKVCRRFQL